MIGGCNGHGCPLHSSKAKKNMASGHECPLATHHIVFFVNQHTSVGFAFRDAFMESFMHQVILFRQQVGLSGLRVPTISIIGLT
jgi:hypothetical protein